MLSVKSERFERRSRGPRRTCVGCRREAAADECVRIVLGAGGVVVPDLAGGASGRGAWLHADPICLSRAVPAGLAKSFRSKVVTGPDQLWALVRGAAERRAAALLSAAWRAGKLEVGATAVGAAVRDGRAELLVVATDARAAASSAAVASFVDRGRGVAWGTKESLGRALGRVDVAIVAVVDEGLSRALLRSVNIARMPPPRSLRGREGPTSSGDGSTEDR